MISHKQPYCSTSLFLPTILLNFPHLHFPERPPPPPLPSIFQTFFSFIKFSLLKKILWHQKPIMQLILRNVGRAPGLEIGTMHPKNLVNSSGKLWLEWFEVYREGNYMGEEYVDEVRLKSQFPKMYQTMLYLGLRVIFLLSE